MMMMWLSVVRCKERRSKVQISILSDWLDINLSDSNGFFNVFLHICKVRIKGIGIPFQGIEVDENGSCCPGLKA